MITILWLYICLHKLVLLSSMIRNIYNLTYLPTFQIFKNTLMFFLSRIDMKNSIYNSFMNIWHNHYPTHFWICSSFFICVIDMKIFYSDPSSTFSPGKENEVRKQPFILSGSESGAEKSLKQSYELPRAAHILWMRGAKV